MLYLIYFNQLYKKMSITNSFLSFRPKSFTIKPVKEDVKPITKTIKEDVKPVAATCIEDLNFTGEFVEDIDGEIDMSRKTLFTLCITPNNSTVFLDEKQTLKLKSNFRKWLDPLFINKGITKFILLDTNDFDVENNKPYTDKSNWIPILDDEGKIKTDKYGEPIIELYSVDSHYNIEFGDKKKNIHTHVPIEILHTGSIYIDREGLLKYLSESWEEITGEHKNINMGNINKQSDYKYKMLKYMQKQKDKKLNKLK